MKPSVSVIIATYNYGQYLAEALDSVLAQTYHDYEIVVVDDGSTDNTADVLLPYLSKPNVRYQRTDHVGQPAAKNIGIRQARGKYIAFLDADDRWLPQKLEKQIARFEADAEVGLVFTRRYWIDEHGSRLPLRSLTLYRGFVLPEIFRNNFVCFSSSMVRRDVLEDVGMFDESIPLAIDYELWLRVASKHHFDYVDERLVEYRTGHANLSRRAEERLYIALMIMRRFLDRNAASDRLTPSHVRKCFAETYEHLGYAQSSHSRLAAMKSYLTSLKYSIFHAPAWLGIMKLPIPIACKRWGQLSIVAK
jgi:Glycosyltransferases, probably involved in cell wall biogenesis